MSADAVCLPYVKKQLLNFFKWQILKINPAFKTSNSFCVSICSKILPLLAAERSQWPVVFESPKITWLASSSAFSGEQYTWSNNLWRLCFYQFSRT